MPIVPIQAVANLDVTNNDKIITIKGGFKDFGSLKPLIFLQIPPYAIVTAVSGTDALPNGDSTITLNEPWPHATAVALDMVGWGYTDGLATATTNVVEMGNLLQGQNLAMTQILTSTDPTIEIATSPTTTENVTPLGYQNLQYQAQIDAAMAIVGSLNIPSMATAEAIRQSVRAQYAGSGFVNTGKHFSQGSFENPAQGITCFAGSFGAGYETDSLSIGRPASESDTEGTSKTGHAVVHINGTLFNLESGSASWSFRVKRPPALDGLMKKDGTGFFTDLAAANLASTVAGALDASVLSAQAQAFTEVFLWPVTGPNGDDTLCPGGIVQSGLTTYAGVPLQTTNKPQGWSAFGTWDTVTTGGTALFSALNPTQQAAWFNHPDSAGRYEHDGEGNIYEWRLRVRVVMGFGNDWEQSLPNKDANFRYDSNNYVIQRGNTDTNIDWGTFSSAHVYLGQSTAAVIQDDSGIYSPHNAGTNTAYAHNGECYAIPMFPIQVLNTGVSHPINPDGCAALRHVGGVDSGYWYDSAGKPISTRSDCFNIDNIGFATGAADLGPGIDNMGDIATGAFRWNGDNIAFDQVAPSQILADNRANVNPISREAALFDLQNLCVSGEARGAESEPWTSVHTANGSNVNANTQFITITDSSLYKVGAVVSLIDAAGVIQVNKGVIDQVQATDIRYISDGNHPFYSRTTELYHHVVETVKPNDSQSTEPTVTSIIAIPERLAATFANMGISDAGIRGTWIGSPTGVSKEFHADNPVHDYIGGEFTDDDGVVFSVTTGGVRESGFEGSSNSVTLSLAVTKVEFLHYKTKAKFTKEMPRQKIELVGNVWAGNVYTAGFGRELIFSLISKVPVIATDFQELPFTQIGISPDDGKAYVGATDVKRFKHGTINLVGTGPAVKAAYNLCIVDGFWAIQFMANEMVWNSGADNVLDFAVKDGTTSQSYTAGTTYAISGVVFDVVVMCLVDVSTVFTGLTLLENGIYTDNSGGAVFETWNGNGYGDYNHIVVSDTTTTTAINKNGDDIIVTPQVYVSNRMAGEG